MNDQSLKYDEEYRDELLGELPSALNTISDTFNVSRKDVSDVFTEEKIDDALYFRDAAHETKWGGPAAVTFIGGGILSVASGDPNGFVALGTVTIALTAIFGVCGKIGASKARKKHGDNLNDYIAKSKAEMQTLPILEAP